MLRFQLIQNRQFRLSVYAVMLAGTLAVAAGCGKTSAGDPAAGGAPQAMPVQIKIAQAENVPDTTEYLSVLKSRHAATINPHVEGYITKIFVKSGDHVTAGTPLVQIDPLVPVFMARQLYSAAATPKELWLVPRAHHADFAQIAGPEYRNRLAGFFERTLL